MNLEDDDVNVIESEHYEMMCHDPALPRTRDYICKNINCITHKKSELKEAVFIRISKKYAKVNILFFYFFVLSLTRLADFRSCDRSTYQRSDTICKYFYFRKVNGDDYRFCWTIQNK